LEINMTRRLFSALLATLPLWAFLSPARATTVAPPPNLGALARASQSVTFAEAVESWVEEGESLPVTVTRFHLRQPVAGSRTGNVFEVVEPGGEGTERAAAVAGAPRFESGQRYLLFLDRAPGGRWRAKMMSYGLLEEVPGTNLLRPLKEAARVELKSLLPVEPVGLYHEGALLRHLGEVAKGTAAWDAKRVAATGAPLATVPLKVVQNSPQYCVFMPAGDGLPMRWFGLETGKTVSMMATTPGQNGISDGGVGAVQLGMAAWTNYSDAVTRFTYGGTRPRSITCSANFDYDQGGMVFNDPCDDIPDLSQCEGTLAFSGSIYDPNSTQTHDGQLWHPVLSTFSIINNGTECIGETSFQETVAHELGHTLGFGHHDPPDPGDALMSAFLKGDGRGAALAIVDKQCA
jgi:hypothetical protein